MKYQYKREKSLFEIVGNSKIGSQYPDERKHCHRVTMQQEFESRPPLHLPLDSESAPAQSTLDKLCFVSAGDSKYFDLLVAMLESIEATRLYNDTPINIIDCGLSKEERDYLSDVLQVREIKPPIWPLSLELEGIPSGLQAMAIRAFLPMNFPGFGYYFWIDADAWIQDERSLAHFISNAETAGLGISCSSPAAAGKCFYTQTTERDTPSVYRPCVSGF